MGDEYIDADFKVVRNTPLSDTSGELIFNSDFPYDNISAQVTQPVVGSSSNIALEYDFENYPPQNLDQGITFSSLVPDSANIVEYYNYDGITLTQYLLTTDNTKYPILITDDYLRWAVPPYNLNSSMVKQAYGSYRDKKNNQFFVFGEGSSIGASGQQSSNFIASRDGLSWSNMKYNNPFLDKIKSYSVDKTSDIGIAIGEGSTYSISILAGTTATGEIWLPIQGSKELISDPKGIIRGSSWIVYGDPGASGSYSIVESQDGLVWTGITGITGSIITADINQFNGTVLAGTNTSPSRIFKRHPTTFEWTSSVTNNTLENVVSLDSITNVAIGSQNGQMGSTGTWLVKGQESDGLISVWFSTDDGQNWNYDANGTLRTPLTDANLTNVFTGTDSDSTYQGWQFFGSDSNNQLNIIELSVTGTVGQLASYSYGVIPLEGLTGLNVNSYCTINSKPLDGITYQAFDYSGTYENLSAVKSVTGQSLPGLTGTIQGSSGIRSYVGTTFRNITGSTGLSSFSLEFTCDKFTTKSIKFTDNLGSSGYYYNFIINDYKNDSGASGGTIYNFETNSYLQGGTSFYKTNVVNNGLRYSENIIFGDMYQFQLTELTKILNEIKRVSNIFGSTTELEKEFFNGHYNYEGISGSQEITKFYTPVLNRRQNNVGTYNFDSFTKLEKLVGYPIKQGLLNLQDLYSQISDPDKAEEFQEIIEKLRLLEYHLSYDETILNTIKSQIQQIPLLQILPTFFGIISTSLTTRFQDALQNLNISTDANNTFSVNDLTYDGNTLFKFTFDGTNLNFYKDLELLQTFVIYNKKNLNISFNIFENIRTTDETTGVSVGITNISFKRNTNSPLKEAIETNFQIQTSESNYVSQMKYIGLIPNTNKDDIGLSGIINNPEVLALITYAPPSTRLFNYAYKIDEQIISKNFYYALTKFITEPKLLRRVAKLMSSFISSNPTFNYYDVKNYSTNTGTLVLPKPTPLRTYQSLYGRDGNSGVYFLNYLFVPIYQAVLTRFGNLIAGSGRNYPNTGNISRFRQMKIETFRTRFAQEDNVFYTSFGSSQDYQNLLELIKSEFWNYTYYFNLKQGTNYTNLITNPTSSTGPFNRLPDRKFVFDFMYKDLDSNINYSYGLPSAGGTGTQAREGFVINNTPGNSILYNQFNNDFKCTTGNIQLLLIDSVTGPTGVSLMSFLNKAYQIADVLDGLTANNQNLSYSIAKTVYPSFFSEVMDSAGITIMESKMLEQNRSDYNLLKKYLDKIIYNTSTDGTLDTSFLRPSYDESIVGATGLTNINNQFLSLMNDARMYGCSAISDIDAYNKILNDYTGITFTPSVTTTQLYNSLIGDYNNTFVPLIKTVLLNQFQLDPTNTEYYFSNEQHRLFNRYLNGPTGGETSGTFYDLMSNTGITYNVRDNIYMNVNEIYNIFAQETITNLSNKVNEVFSGSHNIDDDLILVQAIVNNNNPILEKYTTTIRNLDRQVKVYNDQIDNFNSFIIQYNLVNGVSGGYARFNQMKTDILAEDPPLPISNSGNYEDFIVNIPPFDIYYWIAATGNTANNLSFPEYNPNYRYYEGDWVSFDNYGTTGHSLYQCYNVKRYGEIKGVSPGTLGVTGTLSSLICWEEYHDIPEYDQNFPPDKKGKYDEFNYNELNYSLVGPTGQETFYNTVEYNDEIEYVEGDIVIYGNAPFKCLGSKNLFTGVGQGIPPGFNDDYDIYWKVIGSAGEQLYEYPQSNGVWKLELELNQAFVNFTTLYGLTATFITKNSQNKFVVPNTYNSNFEYNFGDLVLFTDNKIYTCLGDGIVGINPPTINSIAGNAIWKAYPYLNTNGIPDFSITRTYNLGEVVKYKNIAYKFYLDNNKIPNFGSNTGITYKFLDKVEYGGFIFASKINDNIAEPLIPVNIDSYGATAGKYTKQDLIDSKYWSFVSGLTGSTGTLPPRYNFKHDYAYDYNVSKIQPIRVQFANAIWEWTYNPLNINYNSIEQQQYSNLSSIKGIPPYLPEPLTVWDYLPDGSSGMSGYTGSYNDNVIYSEGNIVDYGVDFKNTKLYFKAKGWGFGTAQINEDGDRQTILPYTPDKTISFGTLVKNNYGTYADRTIVPGNDKINYSGLNYVDGNWTLDYGEPKWGSGILYDAWHNSSNFPTDLRKNFADTIEITYNKLVHDLQKLKYYIVDNQGDNNYYFVSSLSGTTSHPQGSNNWLVCKINGSTANGKTIINGITTNKTYSAGDVVLNQFDNNNLWGFTQQYSTTGTINIPTSGFIQLKFNNNIVTNPSDLYNSPYYNINSFNNTGNIVNNIDQYPNTTIPTSLQNLLQTKYQSIPTSSVLDRIKTGLGTPTTEIGIPRDIFKINLTIPASPTNSILAKLEESFNNTQFYYYSGLVKSLQQYEKILIMLNTNLNIVKTLWKKINESLFREIYEAYYQHERYYPGVDGIPLMCKDLKIDTIPSLGKTFIKYGDNLQSMANFNLMLNKVKDGNFQNIMFKRVDSFSSYGFTGYSSYASFGVSGGTGSYPTLLNYGNNNTALSPFLEGTSNWKFYDITTGEEKGPTAANTWYLDGNYFAGSTGGFTGGLIDLQQLSPTYAVILQEYQNLISDIYYHSNIVDSFVGMPLLKLMRDASYMDRNRQINHTMYERGCAIYTGTDVPIFLPIITSNDLDTLSLSFNTDNNNSLWFQMPGGTLGMPMAQLGSFAKSNNYGLIEHYNYDIFPNRYQFQDTKYAFKSICNSTNSDILDISSLQTRIRTNIITNRLRLENDNSIPNNGEWISDNRRVGFYRGTQLGYTGASGSTGFANNTQLVLYQPYGVLLDRFWSDGRDTTNHHNTNDNEDRTYGYGSQTANRIYNGMKYSDENFSNTVHPMGYYRYGLRNENNISKPELVAITDSQLFTYQGKQDISQQNRCMSILPYVFYVKKVALIEPSYTKVTDTTFREILIERRKQESENNKKKFVQIFSIIFMSIIIILLAVVSAITTVFTGGAALLGLSAVWVSVIQTMTLVIAIGISIASAALTLAGKEDAARRVSMFMVNPAGAFMNTNQTTTGLLARCETLATVLSTQTDENPKVTTGILKSRVTYAEYKWAQNHVNYILNNVYPLLEKNYDPYYINVLRGNIESLYRCGEITEKERTQLYLTGLTGTTGYTSLYTYVIDYNNNAIGVRYGTPYPKPFGINDATATLEDISDILTELDACYETIALYETSLLYPRFYRIDYTEYPRNAKILIKDIQYGPATNNPSAPESLTTNRIYTPNTQLYAKFKIEDAGEGFYKTNEFGDIETLFKSFNTLNVSLISNAGITIGFDFMQITSGYCNEGNTATTSYYGIDKFDTSNTKDYLKIPFTYSDPANAIRDLENQSFLITHSLMGITSIGGMPPPGAVTNFRSGVESKNPFYQTPARPRVERTSLLGTPLRKSGGSPPAAFGSSDTFGKYYSGSPDDFTSGLRGGSPQYLRSGEAPKPAPQMARPRPGPTPKPPPPPHTPRPPAGPRPPPPPFKFPDPPPYPKPKKPGVPHIPKPKVPVEVPPDVPDPKPPSNIWKVLGVVAAIVDIAMTIYGAVEAVKEVNAQPPLQQTC